MWFMSLGWKLVRYGERLERSRAGFGGDCFSGGYDCLVAKR